MKTILMLLDNPFTNDRRVSREALALMEVGFEIKMICTRANGLAEKELQNGIEIIRIFDNQFLIQRNFLHTKNGGNILKIIFILIISIAMIKRCLVLAFRSKKIDHRYNLFMIHMSCFILGQ